MFLLLLPVIGTLVGCSLGASPVSSCKDLDTSACLLLQAAKPDLCTDPAFAMNTCQRFCGNCPLECYVCPTPVLNPNDCNTTATCGTNMSCMTKHVHAQGVHDQYIMTCEKKELCLGFGLGFPVGKRSAHASDRTERDVSLSCCDTDFCNFPFLTTSTVRPTTTQPSGCNRDVVFVMDDSGSVGTANFKLSLDFARAIVNQLPIGPYDTQVGMMAFSSHPQVEWYLSSFGTQAEILSAMNKVRYLGGITRTGDALEAVRTQMLRYSHGDRTNADNVVIVLTDGRSNDKSDTIHEANNLHTVSHDVISIVVGSGCNRDVVFVMDDSGSVGTANFKLSLDFARAIVNQLPIGPYDTQVGMMAFSSHPQVEWYLSSFGTQAEILSAMNKVRYLGGITRTGDALEAVRTQMLRYSHGDRTNADNVVIVLTDGRSNDKSDTIHEANNLHTVSHDVISIVVGSGVDLAELNAIATDRHHMLDVRQYSDLNSIIPQILHLVCTA